MIEYRAAGSGVPGARSFTLRCAALIAALALSPMLRAGAAASEDAVLLSSTAPGYVPGMVITAGDRLTLPDGASATLLFRSGQMLRIRGPFEGALSAAEGRSGETAPGLARALQMQGVDAAVIGGTRAASAAPPRVAPDDVRIDPQRSGTYCLKSGDSVWIGRPADGAAATPCAEGATRGRCDGPPTPRAFPGPTRCRSRTATTSSSSSTARRG